jgi:hypothetical protein
VPKTRYRSGDLEETVRAYDRSQRAESIRAQVKAGLAEIETQRQAIAAAEARMATQEFSAVDMQRTPNEAELAEVARVTELVA